MSLKIFVHIYIHIVLQIYINVYVYGGLTVEIFVAMVEGEVILKEGGGADARVG